MEMQLVLIVSLVSCYYTRYVIGVTTQSSENAVVKVTNLIAEVNVMKNNYHELRERVMNNEIKIVDMKNQEKYWKNELENIKMYITCQIEELNDINTENNDKLNETKAALMKTMISFSQSLTLMNETIQELSHSLPEKVRCEDNLTECSSTSVDPCDGFTCDNGGTKTVFGTTCRCTCRRGFSGSLCEVTPCSNNPCLHNGNCSVTSSSFSCRCPVGYSGDLCEVTPCIRSPCLNSGTCFNVDGTYTCACQNGYSGTRCEVTPCSGTICLNQGTCSIVNSNLRCTCKSGFSGRFCEVTPCALNPCRCGACTVSGSSYACSCPSGLQGNRCEDLFDQTLTSPGFPSTYTNNLNLAWTIDAGSRNRVKIVFTRFYLETTHDSVKVYNGASASNLLGSFSGTNIPSYQITTGRNMYITFTTDSSVVYSGFSANIYKILT